MGILVKKYLSQLSGQFEFHSTLPIYVIDQITFFVLRF